MDLEALRRMLREGVDITRSGHNLSPIHFRKDELANLQAVTAGDMITFDLHTETIENTGMDIGKFIIIDGEEWIVDFIEFKPDNSFLMHVGAVTTRRWKMGRVYTKDDEERYFR